MSRIEQYREAELALAKHVAEVEALKNDPALKKEIEFDTELTKLLNQFGMTRPKLITFLGGAGAPAAAVAPKKVTSPKAPSKSGKTRKTREFKDKIYKNPHTGELITVKLVTHGVYKSWIAQYGKEEVESWRQSVS
jgi:hypothetical protein